jgi:hypothetical protein
MAAEPSIRGRPSPVSEGPHQARRHDRFRAASSLAISASFFARVQRFNCRSRVSASSRQSCVTVAKWSRQLHCRLSAALIGANPCRACVGSNTSAATEFAGISSGAK